MCFNEVRYLSLSHCCCHIFIVFIPLSVCALRSFNRFCSLFSVLSFALFGLHVSLLLKSWTTFAWHENLIQKTPETVPLGSIETRHHASAWTCPFTLLKKKNIKNWQIYIHKIIWIKTSLQIIHEFFKQTRLDKCIHTNVPCFFAT